MSLCVNGIAALLLIALLYPLAEAGVGRVESSNPAHPGKCVIESNLILEPGQTVQDPQGGCGDITCEKGSVASIRICVPTRPGPGYKWGDYKSPNADFPKCCERQKIPA